MDKEQFLQMLQSQQASGLSIKAYCQTNGISVSNFTNWKRKYVLNASNQESTTPTISLGLQHQRCSPNFI